MYGFYAVSMVLYSVSGFYGFYSILRLRFPWFPLTLYMFSVVFFGLYAVFMVCIIFVFWFPRLFGFILFLLISIATCAYVLLSWYALRGEALRPPSCTPPPFFNGLPLLLTLFPFFISIIGYLGSFYLY